MYPSARLCRRTLCVELTASPAFRHRGGFSLRQLADRDDLRTRPRRRFRQPLDPTQLSSWRPKPQKLTGSEKGARSEKGIRPDPAAYRWSAVASYHRESRGIPRLLRPVAGRSESSGPGRVGGGRASKTTNSLAAISRTCDTAAAPPSWAACAHGTPAGARGVSGVAVSQLLQQPGGPVRPRSAAPAASGSEGSGAGTIPTFRPTRGWSEGRPRFVEFRWRSPRSGSPGRCTRHRPPPPNPPTTR